LFRERGRRSGQSLSPACFGGNAREIVADGYYPFPERVKVFPNAVDAGQFFPMDRAEARKALGLPLDRFIVAFVGGFIERKGVSVLSRALDEAGASSIFIGRGPVAPDARDILFQGALDHGEIPQYLRRGCFACTTLSRAACNSIVRRWRWLHLGRPAIQRRAFDKKNFPRVDPTDPTRSRKRSAVSETTPRCGRGLPKARGEPARRSKSTRARQASSASWRSGCKRKGAR
jgi:hypothetical protein